MELVSVYVEKRRALLKLAAETKPQLEEKLEVVDLGDLIERLKLQIDRQLGR